MRRMPFKYAIALTLLLGCIFSTVTPALASPSNHLPTMASAIEENLESRAAVLYDVGTGQFLIEKQADERMPIASVTKLMTMLLVLEAIEAGRIRLEDEVVASHHACSYGGSQIYLDPGERFSVKEMLMAVTIKSANDAAIALAEHVAGSESAFVALMNRRAAELGMTNTQFINACGLDEVSVTGESKGYSTARDVAIMSHAVLEYHDELAEWLTTRITYLQRARGPIELFNTNHRFIRNFPGADGLKTGLTSDAGYCLSASGRRGDFRLVAVVLGAATDDQRYRDVTTLLNYGFANFVGKRVAAEGEEISVVKVSKGGEREVLALAEDDLHVLLKKGESLDAYEKRVSIEVPVRAPFTKGTKIGEMSVVKGEEVLATVNLVADRDVEKLGIFGTWFRLVSELLGI